MSFSHFELDGSCQKYFYVYKICFTKTNTLFRFHSEFRFDMGEIAFEYSLLHKTSIDRTKNN